MKKVLLFAVSVFLTVLPCFAVQIIELNQGTEYLYFSDSKIKSIKSNNPDIIVAQRISTISDNDQQILFTAKKAGNADIQIQTEKELINYSVQIKANNAKNNNTFIELDIPGLK